MKIPRLMTTITGRTDERIFRIKSSFARSKLPRLAIGVENPTLQSPSSFKYNAYTYPYSRTRQTHNKRFIQTCFINVKFQNI